MSCPSQIKHLIYEKISTLRNDCTLLGVLILCVLELTITWKATEEFIAKHVAIVKTTSGCTDDKWVAEYKYMNK